MPEVSQQDTSTPKHTAVLRSFASIAVARFFQNRIAVAALIVVWAMATVAVFVPFLANDKPYMIRMSFPNRYDDSFFIVVDMSRLEYQPLREGKMETLEEGEGEDHKKIDPAEKRRELEKLILFQIDEMRGQLGPADRESLAEARAEFKRLFENWDAVAFAAHVDAFEERFDAYNLTLAERMYFPLIRALSWVEMTFIALYFFLHVYFIRMALRREVSPHLLRSLIVIALLALACGGAWRWFYPPLFDKTPYKEIAAENPDQAAVFPPIPYGENENITEDSRAKPLWLLAPEERAALTGTHWLGTDMNGRDVLCRMIFGARIAMTIGLVAVSIYMAIGILLGAAAGYYRGWIDMLISRVIEIVICFPSFFLIITVLAFLRPSIFNIMIVIGLTAWTGVARLMRGEFLRVVNEEYVQSIRVLGGGDARIIFRHILPNAMGPALVLASFGLAGTILAESGLSFLGFGVPQPKASWGTLLYDGRNDIIGAWWLTVFPGLAIFITVTALNLVGEGIRDATDPRFFAD